MIRNIYLRLFLLFVTAWVWYCDLMNEMEKVDKAMWSCGRQPALRIVPMPADLNPAGDVFGGWIMSMADIAGSIAARRRARSRVTTVAVNSFVFKQPVSVGDLVSFYAEISTVGNTSITVDVAVYVERNPENAVALKVTEARLTYVAIDNNGNKRTIPPEE